MSGEVFVGCVNIALPDAGQSMFCFVVFGTATAFGEGAHLRQSFDFPMGRYLAYLRDAAKLIGWIGVSVVSHRSVLKGVLKESSSFRCNSEMRVK